VNFKQTSWLDLSSIVSQPSTSKGSLAISGNCQQTFWPVDCKNLHQPSKLTGAGQVLSHKNYHVAV